MTERQLKYRAGLFLIASHVGLVIFAIILFFNKGFNIDEFTTVMAVITPVFTGYTTSIVAFIIKDAKTMEDTSARVSGAYVGLSFGMPALLVVMVAVAVGMKAFNYVFANFEDFKRFLLLLESLFAAYAGMFVYSLFERKPPEDVARAGPAPEGHGAN
ncbi:hypothetical protein [Variovorax paradoxus]|uniref:hypothetical protein n=1 Tax=Variovorax paradoxus TaxID=34073 RepID=UPI003D64631E